MYLDQIFPQKKVLFGSVFWTTPTSQNMCPKEPPKHIKTDPKDIPKHLLEIENKENM